MAAFSSSGSTRPGARRSPVEIVATMGTLFTRMPAGQFSGLRTGRFGQWAGGVTAMREDCAAFASYWKAHNESVLGDGDGPLWVVLGDSTAQGLGAPTPDLGYVGQALSELRRRTGLPWRVLNLSVSGSVIRDVLSGQLPALPALPARPDLVTCGIGVNDILYTAPGKLFGDLRSLLAEVPDGTVLLDLPVPSGVWGLLGRVSVPYVGRINRVIHEASGNRGLPVARISEQFTAPWTGKFAPDRFHPSQDGYRAWSRALLTALGCESAAPGASTTTVNGAEVTRSSTVAQGARVA